MTDLKSTRWSTIIEILFKLRTEMNAIKFNYALLILCLVFTAQGCSQVLRYKSPDVPDYSLGVLTTAKPEQVRIFTVDGLKATGKFKDISVREFPDTVKLLPGQHEIVPCLLTKRGVRYGEILKFYVQEENTYVINHKFKWDKTLKFWVECNGVDISTE